MDKDNMGKIIETLLSVPKDNPFLEGNERIVSAISDYFANPDDNTLLDVLEAIRIRLKENGQFLLPVNEDQIEDQKGLLFRTLDMKNNTSWLPLFTSADETEKGPESEFMPYSIYQALRDCLNADVDGAVINPWGQDFALPKDLIQMILQANEEDPKSVVGKTLKRSDLADGSLLKEAVLKYCEKMTMPYFTLLLQLLRDCYVFVPCTAVMGNEDQAEVEQIIQGESGGESPRTHKFTNKEEIRFIPDILHDGDKYYFPVFTSVEEMGEYGDKFSKVGEHIMNVMPLAENNEKNVFGLLINPFTDACIIHRKAFDIMRLMPSMVEEETEESDDGRILS